MVAYPDRGEGNDPEPFFFFFFRGVGSLSQPRLNIFTVDNMGVMICLGQGGLHSLSASSLNMNHMDNNCQDDKMLNGGHFNIFSVAAYTG